MADVVIRRLQLVLIEKIRELPQPDENLPLVRKYIAEILSLNEEQPSES